MGALVRSSAVMILAGILVYWYVDAPLPDDVQQKWKILTIDAIMRAYGPVSGLFALLGLGGPFSEFQRSVGDLFFITLTTGRPWVVRDDPALQITDLYTPTNNIMFRMYEPKSNIHQTNRPVFFLFHGGGFSLLSVDVMDPVARKIARDSGIVVMSVEYRLSPQYPFPIPLNDCIEVIKYVIESSTSLRIDPDRIAVGGNSAGGNLAASISLRMKRIKLQILMVPALQFFTYNTSSVIENVPYFSQTSNSLIQIAFWTNYIGCCREYVPYITSGTHTSVHLKQSKYGDFVDQEKWMDKRHMNRNPKLDLTQPKNFGRNDISKEFIDKLTNPYISPLMADEEMLRDLPRAYVMTAGRDIIRDEGIMYVTRMKAAGVMIHLSNHRTAFHNDLFFVEGPFKLDIADVIIHDIVEYMQLHL